MKKLLVLTFVLASLVSYGQVKKVSNETTKVFVYYFKDKMDDNEYLFISKSLVISNENKTKGFILHPSFKKIDGTDKWEYSFIIGDVVKIGGCHENDKLDILFDDGSKINLTSWNNFNCNGDSNFDLNGEYLETLSKKSIKTIRLTNGRSYDSFEKTFTKSTDKNYFIDAFRSLEEYNSRH